jgi:hypothetical protein
VNVNDVIKSSADSRGISLNLFLTPVILPIACRTTGSGGRGVIGDQQGVAIEPGSYNSSGNITVIRASSRKETASETLMPNSQNSL